MNPMCLKCGKRSDNLKGYTSRAGNNRGYDKPVCPPCWRELRATEGRECFICGLIVGRNSRKGKLITCTDWICHKCYKKCQDNKYILKGMLK